MGGSGLKDADLTGANLTGARVPGVDLTGANLTGARVKGVLANKDTAWPERYRVVRGVRGTWDVSITQAPSGGPTSNGNPESDSD